VVVTDGSSLEGIVPGSEAIPMPRGSSRLLRPRPCVAPGDLAHVIYTSGSTGRPNGVRVTQHNVTRLFTVTEPLYGFGPGDVWSLFHSIAFDFSVWEMWGALLYGGRLLIVPEKTAKATDAFHSLVVSEGVTVLNQTPSAFRAFDMADAAAGRPKSRLRYVIFGGEALDPRTLRAWFEAHGDERPRLVNMYGITETTVHVTYRRMRAESASAIGQSLIGAPLPDLRIELLGPNGDPVDEGEVGEICVGGEGVADGYLARPELTAKRFRPDPRGKGHAARLYYSGDLARRLPDGDLEYLGRSDDQVKLRGYRIELGEIEAALRDATDVRDAVVALRDDLVHRVDEIDHMSEPIAKLGWRGELLGFEG
jgi:amino acid adenylation domain-containing protein